MADRSIKINLDANVTGLVNGFKTAQTAATNLNKTIAQNGQSVQTLTTGLGLVGAAGVAGAALAIKTYASFDKQMSAVKATGGATASELTRLREKAVEMGASTAFSASEAAAGIENLLKAGVTAQEVLGGGLAGALDLAASGELGVAQAAEIAAGAMTQFKLSGADVPHIADLLAAGAGKAQGEVADMANALKYAGVPLAQLGVSIEETAGTIALFASNAIIGEQAGTSLRSMIASLTSPSAVAAKEMEKLGINVFDGQDKFIGLSGVAGVLQTQMRGLSDAERAAALGRIFGNESLQAANVLYDGGAAAVQKWTNAVNDQGYAAETAAARLDNLHGDLEAFGGAVETAFINAGGAGNDALRGLVQNATGLVNALGQLDEGVLNTGALLVGGGGLVALGTAGLGKLVVGINEAKVAMTALGISSKAAGFALGGVGAALGIAAVGLTVWAQNAAEAQARTEGYMETLDELGARTTDTVSRINEALTQKDQNNFLDNLFGDDPDYLIDRAEKIGVSIQDLQNYILGEADAIERVTAAAEGYVLKGDEYATATDKRRAASEFILGALNAEASSLSDAERAAALKAQADQAAGVASGEAAKPVGELSNALEAQAKAADDAFDSMQKHTGALLDARGAARDLEAAIDEASETIKDNGKTLDRNSDAGRENEAVLDGIVAATMNAVEKERALGASQSELSGIMRKGRKAFLDAAEAAGMNAGQARRLANELGLVPKNVRTQVTVSGIEAAQSRLGALDSTLNSINGKVVTATVAIKRHGQAAMAEGGAPEIEGRIQGAVSGGQAGKDSVPAVLMPGEHVLTTRDVHAMGGQGAVYAFRSRLHRGVQKFAGGGEVRRRLNEARRELGIDMRRGDVLGSATSGLSSAYSVIDRMLSLAMSGDLSRGKSRTLAVQAGAAEKAMRGLYKQSERLDQRLESARGRLEDLANIKAQVGSALAGEQKLSAGIQAGQFRDVTRTNSRGETWTEQVWDAGNVSAKGLVNSATTKAATLKAFASKLAKLRKLGLSPVVLQEIAEAGSEEGSILADAFLADQGQIKGINAAYKDIAKYSTDAGTQVAEGFGLSAAQSLVKGLEREQAKVGKQIERWGVYMANGLIGALGGKKIKARAKGGPVSAGLGYLVGEEGPEFIVPRANGFVMTAEQTRRLASTAQSVRSSGGGASGPSVVVQVDKVIAADTKAAVDRMYVKAWDAINANGVMALAQGVGV